MAYIDPHWEEGCHARVQRTIPAMAFLSAGAAMKGCMPEGSGKEPGTTALPNPAAVFCVDSGGAYEIRRAADGSETGVCILADGAEVDAWTYFREKAARS
jgi:putative hemolysin